MREEDTGHSGLEPIRGNNIGIVNECDRLKDLAQRLDSTAAAIASIRAETWTGRARDHFDEVQYALGKSCRRAADSHSTAALALRRYQEALEDLQLRADSEIKDARESADPSRREHAEILVARWHGQLATAGRDAAEAIRTAARDLLDLGRIPSTTEPLVPPPPPIQARPRTVAEPRQRHVANGDLPSPYTALHDASYTRQLSDLNRAVFDALRNA